MYRIALCDDEKSFVARLQNILELNFRLYNCNVFVEAFTSGKALIETVEKQKKCYDIICLDIAMPELNGLAVAKRLRELDNNFILAFTTNMENEAAKGYHFNAFRFILKNSLDIDIDEFVSAIMRKSKILNDGIIEVKYRFKDSYNTIHINKADIILLETKERRVFLKTVNGEYELLKYPLKKYERMIDGKCFYILNRSYLVNFEHVLDLKDDCFLLTGDIIVSTGYSKVTKLAIRRQYMQYLRERI